VAGGGAAHPGGGRTGRLKERHRWSRSSCAACWRATAWRTARASRSPTTTRATGDTGGLDLKKAAAAALLREGVERLALDQDMLYAQDRWAVLCIFQAMDAAGKDSAIKHVFSGANP